MSPMITSTSNQRIKEARKLHDRRGRGTTNRLLLEGVRLISDAVQSGVLPDLVFYTPEAVLTNVSAARLVQQLQTVGVECLPCTPAVFATLAETVTPQGVAARVPLPNLATPPHPTFILVLDQVRDPGNAGTLLRTAEAAGVDLVLFAPETVDPYNDKVMRAAMGAHFRLPLRTCATWSDVQAWLTPRHQCYVAESAAPTAYDQVDWHPPVAFIVGGEAEGASSAARAAAQPVAIPMHGAVESLNAAIAGAIILFEAARQRRQVIANCELRIANECLTSRDIHNS
ncbi:MAG: RNA methyltransferase [Chloroflexota bacterium]|nr:RNA methyltransferase [Chloroflexota bacterium]